MAVAEDWNIRRRPLWQRPDLERHVNDLELASIDIMIEMGAVHVPESCQDGETPVTEAEVRNMISSALFVANVDPAKIYAYLSTGYLVTVENVGNWSSCQLTAWNKAVAAYNEKQCCSCVAIFSQSDHQAAVSHDSMRLPSVGRFARGIVTMILALWPGCLLRESSPPRSRTRSWRLARFCIFASKSLCGVSGPLSLTSKTRPDPFSFNVIQTTVARA